jgi:hypothetical protein
MKFKAPINENYAATIVRIDNIIPLANCDNVVHTSIFGNLVVVDKDTQKGTLGIYFPVETKLSHLYLFNNNLYRDNTQNWNINEKGYFEENGRIRCVKFRGNKSEGLFMPISSLLHYASIEELATTTVGDVFDEINGIKICEKYVPRIVNMPGAPGSKKDKNLVKKTSRLIEGQFRFHGDTAMLGKNIFKIKPDTLIQITNKLHGTSFVVGNILCKTKLNWKQKLARFFGSPVVNSGYDIIWSSRKVIKNDDAHKDYNHYYGEDLWAEIAADLKPYLIAGMTIYGEAVGFTKSGKAIQSGYDYGYDPLGKSNLTYGIYIYRITYTNTCGNVFEFSAKQVQDWCKANGLNPVPQYFYGYAGDLYKSIDLSNNFVSMRYGSEEAWQGGSLTHLLQSYNMEKDCELCKNKVPAEGIVLRVEDINYEAYKLKSFRFRERETKELDKGDIDMETQESQEGEEITSI